MPFVEQKHPRGPGGRFAAKLSAAADRLEMAADASITATRLTNTPRRAAMASNAVQRAQHDKMVARLLRSIAGAQRDGAAGHHLGQLSNRQPLESLLKARRFPHPYLHDWFARDLHRHLQSRGASEEELAAIPSHLEADTSVHYFRDESGVQRYQGILALAKKHAYPDLSRLRDGGADAARLRSIGVVDEATLRAARAELQALGSLHPEQEDPVAALERKLIGQKIPGFFPTPRTVASQMVHLAAIQPGMTVLEPSSGKGDLAAAAREAGGVVSVVEPNSELRNILAARGFSLVGSDALAHQGEYDRILMNPPFENHQDITHIQYAYDHNLRPGGRLVSVVGAGSLQNQSRQAAGFRQWLADHGATIIRLPDGSFSTTEAFRTTAVRCGLVVLNKPQTAEFARLDPSEYEPHFIGRGPRKGQLVFRHVVTHRLRDTLPGLKMDENVALHKGAGADAMMSQLFGGKPLSTNQIKALGCAVDGSVVSVTVQRNRLRIFSDGKGVMTRREFYRDRTGQLVAENHFIEIQADSPHKGQGANLFARQVEELGKLKVQTIFALAQGEAGDPRFVGYKVWPRMGYDGPLPRSVIAKLPPSLAHARSLASLLDTPGGAEFWDKHGSSVAVSFDPTPGSDSRSRLDAYMASRRARSAGATSAAPLARFEIDPANPDQRIWQALEEKSDDEIPHLVRSHVNRLWSEGKTTPGNRAEEEALLDFLGGLPGWESGAIRVRRDGN